MLCFVDIVAAYMHNNYNQLLFLLLCFRFPVGKVGSKNKEDAPYELESQFVLRLPTVSVHT